MSSALQSSSFFSLPFFLLGQTVLFLFYHFPILNVSLGLIISISLKFSRKFPPIFIFLFLLFFYPVTSNGQTIAQSKAYVSPLKKRRMIEVPASSQRKSFGKMME